MTSEHAGEDWALFSQVCQTYRTLSDAFMEDISMHRAQALLLCRLFCADGVTQSELAEQLAVQGATVTCMLQRMEEAGLVARRRDKEDNRLVRVYLTTEGRERERAIKEQFGQLESVVFEGMSQEERQTFRGMLCRILHNIDTHTK